MNQVFVCGTYFHIYLSILKSIYRKDKNSKFLIVINDRTPDVEKIFPALKASGYFDSLLQVPFVEISRKIKTENRLLSKINRNKFAVKFVDANSDISKYDEFIRGAEINLFSNLGLSPTYFILKYKKNFIRMIEDGEGNYISRIGKFQAFKRKYILNTVVGEGHDAPIKEIEVQYPEKLNPRIRKKGKLLELKKMQQELTEEDREKILNIFMSGFEVSLTGKKNLLLITQPLSEDNHMSENQKIALYDRIVQHYAKDYTLFIKGHPRELTDYHGKIKAAFVPIPHGFPLEMFDLLKGIHFDVGVTVSSSSIHNVTCIDKKIILGRKYFKEPLPANWYESVDRIAD